MELIKKLQDHITDYNIDYINDLVDIIIEEKMTNLDSLKEYEIKYNNIGSNNSYDEVIIALLNEIDHFPFEYEGLLYDDIQALKQERKLIDSNNIDDKIFHIIKYCQMTNRYNPFPYKTYQFIVNGFL